MASKGGYGCCVSILLKHHLPSKPSGTIVTKAQTKQIANELCSTDPSMAGRSSAPIVIRHRLRHLAVHQTNRKQLKQTGTVRKSLRRHNSDPTVFASIRAPTTVAGEGSRREDSGFLAKENSANWSLCNGRYRAFVWRLIYRVEYRVFKDGTRLVLHLASRKERYLIFDRVL